jgi:hypothetical protein
MRGELDEEGGGRRRWRSREGKRGEKMSRGSMKRNGRNRKIATIHMAFVSCLHPYSNQLLLKGSSLGSAMLLCSVVSTYTSNQSQIPRGIASP